MSYQTPTVDGQPVIDMEIGWGGTVSCNPNTTGNVIFSGTLKFGKKPYLVGFRMAWDAAIDGHTTWHALINGARIPGLESSTIQFAPPEADYYLPRAIPLEQGGILSGTADIDNGVAVAGNVTMRPIVYYTSI